jgi:hypothetical protein
MLAGAITVTLSMGMLDVLLGRSGQATTVDFDKAFVSGPPGAPGKV